jgi:DNA-3-methyladenine glycosylase
VGAGAAWYKLTMSVPALDRRVLATDVVAAAPMLLGATLACRGTAGVIIETEAYHQDEASCHAHKGITERSRGLFGEPGTAYVYFTYGMHWCFNVVTNEPGVGAAVLVRALVPLVGAGTMRTRRQRPGAKQLRDVDLCSGPAKLVQALDIRSTDNGAAVISDARTLDALLSEATDGPRVAMLDRGLEIDSDELLVGPRIGISQATELPWRFGWRSPYLSKRF